jgi:hypothetical protein
MIVRGNSPAYRSKTPILSASCGEFQYRQADGRLRKSAVPSWKIFAEVNEQFSSPVFGAGLRNEPMPSGSMDPDSGCYRPLNVAIIEWRSNRAFA